MPPKGSPTVTIRTAAEPVPGLALLNVGKVAELNDIACAPGGNCVATGNAQLDTVADDVGVESFAMTERSGAWSRPTLLSVGGGTTESDALACGPDGDCSVGRMR